MFQQYGRAQAFDLGKFHLGQWDVCWNNLSFNPHFVGFDHCVHFGAQKCMATQALLLHVL